ncbi:unnamed protein product, partial [Meganyctiphanes norvegica]
MRSRRCPELENLSTSFSSMIGDCTGNINFLALKDLEQKAKSAVDYDFMIRTYLSNSRFYTGDHKNNNFKFKMRDFFHSNTELNFFTQWLVSLQGTVVTNFRMSVFGNCNMERGPKIEILLKLTIYIISKSDQQQKRQQIIYFDRLIMRVNYISELAFHKLRQYIFPESCQYYLTDVDVVLHECWFIAYIRPLGRITHNIDSLNTASIVRRVSSLKNIMPCSEILAVARIQSSASTPFSERTPCRTGHLTSCSSSYEDVTFAQSGTSTQSTPESIKHSLMRTTSGGLSLDIQPNEELMFNSCSVGAAANITISNPSETTVAFKIKTTSPEKYRVRPSLGILEGGRHQDISVSLNDNSSATQLVRDKFLVMAVHAQSDNLNSQEVSQLFRTGSKEDVFEVRLRVGVAAADNVTQNVSMNSTSVKPQPSNSELMAKMDQMLQRQTALDDQLRSARRMVYILFNPLWSSVANWQH